MGLIDADKLKKDLKSITLNNGTLLNTNTVLLLLDKYPTAYNVDKVVEQLSDKFRFVRTDEDLEWNRAMYEAIKIVKGGGVNG